jgi:hypothetical protein
MSARALSITLSIGLGLAAAQSEAQVTVYQHTNFGGTSGAFGVGEYRLSALQARGVANDWISSVRVASGHTVTFFANDNFGGATLVKTADDSTLVNDDWNDRVSSMRVTTGSGGGPGTVVYTRNGHTLTLVDKGGNVTQATKDRIVETFFAGYVAERARFNTGAPASVTLTIDPAYTGVAATSGARVTCSAAFLVSHPFDADGCGTHEFMHVAQAYTQGNNPGWAVEGLADYARFKYGLYNAQTGWALPAFSPSQHYTNAYRVTARFFVWLENRVRPTLPDELDDAMKSGTYSPSFWTFRTGFTVDQLWAQYSANPTL